METNGKYKAYGRNNMQDSIGAFCSTVAFSHKSNTKNADNGIAAQGCIFSVRLCVGCSSLYRGFRQYKNNGPNVYMWGKMVPKDFWQKSIPGVPVIKIYISQNFQFKFRKIAKFSIQKFSKILFFSRIQTECRFLGLFYHIYKLLAHYFYLCQKTSRTTDILEMNVNFRILINNY